MFNKVVDVNLLGKYINIIKAETLTHATKDIGVGQG
jgi:hypothetical protein